MSPFWRTRSAASNWPRAHSSRRPSKPSVASASMVGMLPKLLPKLLSTPQMATRIAGATP